jgi:hypothetical protein
LPAQIPCPLFSEFLGMCTALMSNIGFIFVGIKLTDPDRIQESVIMIRVVFFILNLRSLLGGKETSIIPFFLRNLPVLKRSCDLVILSLGLQPKLNQHHFVTKISSSSSCSYYIGYKALKKRIRLYGNRASIATNEERQEIMKSFSELLDSQVKLSHLFFTSFSLDLRVDTNWSKMTDYTFFVSV